MGPSHHIELTKAALAKAIGYYHERPAASFLQGNFAFTWIHQMPEASAPPVIVTPDGAIDLQWIGGNFRVAGPDKEPKIEILPAGTTVIGFRFQPAAAAAWLGVPANEILGERLYLQELSGRALVGWLEECAPTKISLSLRSSSRASLPTSRLEMQRSINRCARPTISFRRDRHLELCLFRGLGAL